MSGDTDRLHEDTGMPAPPLPPTEIGVLWEELSRTNQLIVQLRTMIFTGLRELASDLGVVERRVQAFEADRQADRQERGQRQRYLDRLLWAGLALAAAHLLIDMARLRRRSDVCMACHGMTTTSPQ